MFELLDETQIDPTIPDFLKIAYSKERSALKINGHRTEPFNIEKGVRQGS